MIRSALCILTLTFALPIPHSLFPVPETISFVDHHRYGRAGMESKTHILIIEDDFNLARFLELELGYENYQVTVVHDGMTGLITARECEPDLILLDCMLPQLSGLELCHRLRETQSRIPIIFLTAKDEISDRVLGLDSGGNDYVIKPFSLEELLARIRVHLRFSGSENEREQLTFSGLSLNRKTRDVYQQERQIQLTATEFDLLEYLLLHPRQVLTREQILEAVWGFDFGGDSNIIEVYIRYLRLKLEANQEARLIHTVRGVGYVLKEE